MEPSLLWYLPAENLPDFSAEESDFLQTAKLFHAGTNASR
jgi:hypothetical protein